MSKLFFSLLFSLVFLASQAQNLYVKSFGDRKATPVIFLHGGPGYNSASFEATTAQKLAENGFFVIVYDRRGEGRSLDKNAQFNFDESYKDIKAIYAQMGIEKAVLIGHSFGGIVATLFAEKNPILVQSVVLVGAPVSLQESFRTIIKKSKQIYEQKKDSVNLKYIALLEKMDSDKLEYSSYCFGHAMSNGFYSPKQATAEAKSIYATFKTDTLLQKYASKMTYPGPKGFYDNEHYTTIDLTNSIKDLKLKKMPIYGLYGKEDGLYSVEQIKSLMKLIGKKNVKYLDNCSHSVFVDQQTVFIASLKKWSMAAK